MKIGILTYHRSLNFGAMLQAVALRIVLERLGYKVSYVDYWPEHQVDMYRLFNFNRFRNLNFYQKIKYAVHVIITLCPELIKRYHFSIFYKEHIKKYLKPVHSSFDAVVYGSDQIWRWQNNEIGFNKVYFGDNSLKTQKHISYAASMGKLPSSSKASNIFINLIKNINCISVRERSLLVFLSDNGINNVSLVLDPTLLLNVKEWCGFVNEKRIIKEPYLLLYDLQKCVINYDDVRCFAKKRGLKIVRIKRVDERKHYEGDRKTDGPLEFLNLIKNASFVITSSYHGLIFSIIFNCPFLSFFKENRDRPESLLSVLGLSDYLLDNSRNLPDDVEAVNWVTVNNRIESLRADSINYLVTCLR